MTRFRVREINNGERTARIFRFPFASSHKINVGQLLLIKAGFPAVKLLPVDLYYFDHIIMMLHYYYQFSIILIINYRWNNRSRNWY